MLQLHLHQLRPRQTSKQGAVEILPVFLALFSLQVAALHQVVESLPQLPAGWTHVRAADADHVVCLSIALAHPDLDNIERTFYEISDPGHAKYGNHLTRDELLAIVRPRAETTAAVTEWLRSAGIQSRDIGDAGQWIHFRATVARAEILLDAQFGVFQRDDGDDHAVRTLQYAVPAQIRRHIDTIQPTTDFKSTRSMMTIPPMELEVESSKQKRQDPQPASLSGSPSLATCRDNITPACLRKLYKLENYWPVPVPGSLLGIVGFSGQNAQLYELGLYEQQFAQYAIGQNFSVALVNGGQNVQSENVASGEANLDIQLAVAMAYPMPVRYYSVGGEGPNVPDLDNPLTTDAGVEAWLEFLSYMLRLSDRQLPQTLSISYGENEQEIPEAYARNVCSMFGQLGARGVTVFVSSGDLGVGQSCLSNDGKNTTKFLPQWPASCPWVTTVGGTMSNSPEVVATYVGNASSSGGFSDYYPRPRYQDDAVRTYLGKLGTKWAPYFNRDGRGFPDISAQSLNLMYVNHNVTSNLGAGTSAAAPIVASMFAMINNDRVRSGKPPMGFLNPWLYQVGYQGLTDITVGQNLGCGGTSRAELPSPRIPGAGFPAKTGWDPATGLGTPLFSKLRQLALS